MNLNGMIDGRQDVVCFVRFVFRMYSLHIGRYTIYYAVDRSTRPNMVCGISREMIKFSKAIRSRVCTRSILRNRIFIVSNLGAKSRDRQVFNDNYKVSDGDFPLLPLRTEQLWCLDKIIDEIFFKKIQYLNTYSSANGAVRPIWFLVRPRVVHISGTNW